MAMMRSQISSNGESSSADGQQGRARPKGWSGTLALVAVISRRVRTRTSSASPGLRSTIVWLSVEITGIAIVTTYRFLLV